jgi:hypothetical protein
MKGASSVFIDWDKPVQTRDGRQVRIYARDGQPGQEIHGATKDGGYWVPRSWNSQGIFDCGDGGVWDCHDLVNVPEKRKVKVVINVYPTMAGAYTGSNARKNADCYRQSMAIAVVEREIEYTVGEGL